MSTTKTIMSQASNQYVAPTYIEDVFSTYLYDGSGSTQTITNGIDLAGEGGLVWTKSRSSVTNHALTDTERGKDYTLASNTTSASAAIGGGLASFNSDGYATADGDTRINDSGKTYTSWTWRKAPRFFDVVTYTGDGVSGRTISHNLGIEPGCIFVKRTDGTRGWGVYHRSIGATQYLVLESTQAAASSTGLWNDTSPSDSVFTVGDNLYTNGDGYTYVAYLFAHDPLGPSGDGSDGLIACGSYTGNGSSQEIDIGWEPQFVLIKNASATGSWVINDVMRGMFRNGSSYSLLANATDAENTVAGISYPHAKGFGFITSDSDVNGSGSTYIYMAIRRPMKTPSDATQVFSPTAYTSNNTDNRLVDTGIVTDAVFARARLRTTGFWVADRNRGNHFLNTSNTTRQDSDVDSFMTPTSGYGTTFSAMNGFGVGNDVTRFLNYSSDTQIAYAFKRAPGFFDTTMYTGDGVAGLTVPHNLGVAPEMMIVKRFDVDGWAWAVYHAGVAVDPETDYLLLDSTAGKSDNVIFWNDTAPTDSVFTVGTYSGVNASAGLYTAYLFASVPGVSKVGSYTGNGTSQTIDCGFTSGARFVLIKRTDASSNWKVMDTARGIVAGDDKVLELDNTAAETTFDLIDPDNSGFIVEGNTTQGMNQSGASYIFYAIA